ncbi:MAG: hypothetical protein KF767_06845 [Bdellovibrionaceae bacterium]|nr:hypothetical protein [Pseudobdellovibrionaceae bacterium]
MAEQKSPRRAVLSGAIFGGVIGIAVALVQVVLFMAGTTSYNVSGISETVTTAGSSDFTGFVALPLLIVLGFAGAGAALASRAAKPPVASGSPYA